MITRTKNLPQAFIDAYWPRIGAGLNAFHYRGGPDFFRVTQITSPQLGPDAPVPQAVLIFTVKFSEEKVYEAGYLKHTVFIVEPATEADRKLIEEDAKTVTKRVAQWDSIIKAIQEDLPA
jgi:hypothetical protein